MTVPHAPAAVASPCTGVCRIGARGWCIGCARTLDEIAAWPALDDDARRRMLARLATRRPCATGHAVAPTPTPSGDDTP